MCNIPKVFRETDSVSSVECPERTLFVRDVARESDENEDGFLKDEGYRSLAQPATGKRMIGAHGAQEPSVFNIHKDPSTGATTQAPVEVGLRQRSNEIRIAI